MREAIDSAVNQTYKNIEVIIINDGSNDGGKTRDIALSYGSKIRYFEKKNGGVSTALNLGIKKMTGEYFCWLSHDDLFSPNRIEEDIKFFDRKKIEISYSSLSSINEKGKVIEEKNITLDIVAKPHDALKLGGVHMCSMTIHKSCFDKAGLFNESNYTMQDVEMTLLLSKYYTFHFNPKSKTFVRLHPERGSHTMKSIQNEEQKKICHFLKTNFTVYDFFKLEDDVDNKILSKCYQTLAGICTNFSSYEIADDFFKNAYLLCNKKLSITYISYMLGSKRVSSFPVRNIISVIKKCKKFRKFRI